MFTLTETSYCFLYICLFDVGVEVLVVGELPGWPLQGGGRAASNWTELVPVSSNGHT